MKKFIALIAIVLSATYAQAQTGTPQTKAGMSNEINSNLPDNTVGAITPVGVRQTLQDMLASWQQWTTVNAVGTNYAVQAADYGHVIRVTAGSVTVTLPAMSASFVSFNVLVWNQSGSTATVAVTGPTLINSANSITLQNGQALWVVSDGSNYYASQAGSGNLSGTASGTSTVFATSTGTLGNGDCVSIDANHNIVDAGGPCTTGGGGGTVAAATKGQFGYYTANTSTIAGTGNLIFDPGKPSVTIGAATNTVFNSLHSVLQTNQTGGSSLDLSSVTYGNQTATGKWAWYKTRNASVTGNTVVQSNDALGGINAYGNDGTTAQPAGQIVSEVDDTPGSGSMPGRWRFLTTQSSSITPTEALRIDSNQLITEGAVPNTILGCCQSLVQTNQTGGSNFDFSSVTYGNSNDAAGWVWYKTRSTTPDGNGAVVAGDLIGAIFASSDTGSGSSAASSGVAIKATVDGAPSGSTVPGRWGLFTRAAGGTLTERLRLDSTGNIWGNNFNGYTDLRLWASLSCNAASPSSTNVGQAAVTAYNAGYRHFFIPAGCFINTAAATPWATAFGARTIPSETFWLGEDWRTSGISVCSSYTACTPSVGTTLGGTGPIVFTNLFTMDGNCYNVDSAAFGRPQYCPIQHQITTSGSFSQGVTYPGGSLALNVGAFSAGGTWNGTDQPAIGINNETAGDGLFIQIANASTAAHFLNFFENGIGVATWNQDGKISAGNSASSHASGMITITDATGTCQIFTNTSGSPGFACSSDERVKTDIVDTGDALDWLVSFRVRDFTMRSDDSRQTGIVAQELEATHPDMVTTGKDGMLQAFSPPPWKMIKAMQQMQAEIEVLDHEIRNSGHAPAIRTYYH